MRAVPLPFVLAFVSACSLSACESSRSAPVDAPDGADPVGPTAPATPDPTTDPTTGPTTSPPEPVPCTPPPLLRLDDLPASESLSAVDGSVIAAFEVDGDALVGAFYRDRAVAEGALGLWQELVMRIPTNQRAQLVQLNLIESDDLAAFVDNVGTSNQVHRYGPTLNLNVSNIADNDPDVCAPLSGHRGTYDWTLIHEFGHLRQYADGTVDDFVETFRTPTGDGLGYPADGSPSLDGDFVTSYAERAGGDEDAAESFTAFVMLDPLPTDDTIAGDKVRFFADVPDYAALRLALRVTEPGGGGVVVPDAPLVQYTLDVQSPDWLIGDWQGAGPNGPVAYTFSEDDLVFSETVGDVTTTVDYAHLRDDGTLATVRVVESSEDFHLLQVAIGGESYSETFMLQGETVLVEREHLGVFTISRVP